MALDADDLNRVAAVAAGAGSAREAVGTLRALFPGLRVSTVDAFDMRQETPALSLPARLVFLMTTDGHCWSITHDPTDASAIVLAERPAA